MEALSPFEIVHRGYQESNAALRRVNEALESEARRIAHALHDEVGPLLVSVHMALHGLDEQISEVEGAVAWPRRARSSTISKSS